MKGKGAYVKDLNGKSIKELVQMRNKLRWESYKLEMKHAIKGLPQTHKIKQLRRDIARVSTILTRKIKERDDSSRK